MSNLLQFPIATEKALGLAERENTIIYVVRMDAKKPEIKKAFEEMFNVKVDRVNTVIVPRNEKRAFIRLKKNYLASDIAKKLKLV